MKEKIKKILEGIFGINAIPDDISQQTCVEWDSMNHLQLVVELESKFNISFEPEDIAEMDSLDAIEEKIKKYCNN
jgi:acyl carrier protein